MTNRKDYKENIMFILFPAALLFILEEEKLHNMVTIGEYPLYIVPIDEDVLSFELDLAYKECQVDGDTSSLWHIAKAIHKLEFSFGVIPNLRAKGKASVRVADILNRMQAEEPVNSSDVIMLYSVFFPFFLQDN
ncbi:vacuolar protein-sorting-associated protein 33 homolog [Arachis duranensis]|uniref:Vacuolar protein-sorting-associated protein 33 homolog n=1 Tax=Arachis duranensis TaxID=130453 RepID=A0A9C6TRY3_ARADU|nr:vacuolar protein-sorting-associated protein 33 homolog [Arachis duranensis]